MGAESTGFCCRLAHFTCFGHLNDFEKVDIYASIQLC